MRLAYVGNFQPDLPAGVRAWSTETHWSEGFELAGLDVVRVQEREGVWSDLPDHAAEHGADFVFWTRTWGLDRDLAGQAAGVAACRRMGLPVAAGHLDKFFGLPREHQVADEPWFHCLPGDVLVSAASVSGVTRRPYRGTLVHIDAGEHELTATPNHPILTTRGWVAAGQLVEGDNLICYAGRGGTAGRGPDVHDGPAAIEQVFEAARQPEGSLASRGQRVGGVPMDFHGDGTGDNIEAVRPDWHLHRNGQPGLEPFGDARFLLAAVAEVHLPRARSKRFQVPHGSVQLRRRAATGLHPSLSQYPADHGAPQVGADLLHRGSSVVSGHDLIAQGGPLAGGRGRAASRPGPHPGPGRHQPFVREPGGNPGGIRDLLHRCAGFISLAKVRTVRSGDFDGHVFNLSTAEGAYLANGIVTHNCDVVFTADGGNQDRFEAAGVRHVWLPPAVHEPECEPGRWRAEMASDVAFVGSWRGGYHPEWTHRAELVDRLRRYYGPIVKFWPERPGVQVRGRDLADLYASASVLVGDSCMVDGRGRYWSDRVPETLGRGGLLVHPDTDWGGQYEPGSHLLTWPLGDWRSMKATVDLLLSDPPAARAMAQRGRAHVLAHHTYTVRARQVVAELERRGLVG